MEEKHTSPAIVLEKFIALEKRTDGKFLNASPSARETAYQK
jgi:hypothetical protein